MKKRNSFFLFKKFVDIYLEIIYFDLQLNYPNEFIQ